VPSWAASTNLTALRQAARFVDLLSGTALSLTHCVLSRLQLSCLLNCKQFAFYTTGMHSSTVPACGFETEQGNNALASQPHQVLTTMS